MVGAYEAGRKDMAKELEKKIEKEKARLYEGAKRTHEKDDVWGHVYSVGSYNTLEKFSKHLGEDKEGEK